MKVVLPLAVVAALLAGAVQAQTPTPIPAAPGAASVEKTTIGDLLANDSSKAVLQKDMPDLVSYPGIDQVKGMTLRDISAYPQAQLDDAKLNLIQKDLDAAAKK
jgi:hypothetical protein